MTLNLWLGCSFGTRPTFLRPLLRGFELNHGFTAIVALKRVAQIVKGPPPRIASRIECVRIRLRLPHNDRCVGDVRLISHEVEADEAWRPLQLRENSVCAR